MKGLVYIKKTIQFLKVLMIINLVIGTLLNVLGGVGMLLNTSSSEKVQSDIISYGKAMIIGAGLFLFAVIVCMVARNMILMFVFSVAPAIAGTVFTAYSVRAMSLISSTPDTILIRHMPIMAVMIFVGVITVLTYFSDEQKAKRKAKFDRDNAPTPSIIIDD